MATIKKDTLHPENEPEVDIYPKTSIDQVENLQANLDALNGDIANANGEIANISANVETIANRVEIAENSITVLTTAYESYTDYTEVTNGFLLTYLSGRQLELPIKAGTNVTFSKYPGSNQIIINFTGGSVPENIALLDANNTFSGSNTFSKLTYFNNQIALDINPISFNDDTKNMSLVFNYNGFIKRFVDTGNVYSINIPNKTGTIALTTDIPTLADYPTTIFFNNYKAGIGYKDTSTGTIKTVVSTDNNGAQIVIGDSNTGLTLATNARPKVLEDSTVKEVAYVSDIPENIALLDANNTFSGSNTFSKLTYFNNQIALDINPISFNDDTKNMSLVFNYNGFIKRFVDTGNVYSINIPNKTGTIALTTDIPTLADYPTTIFFNNYKAGIGYKDTSTGTIKTVVSTDNNGAQIVIGDSNTGLTLATNARPKVLEDSTVKEVAYVSDIPNTSSFATLAGNNKWTGDNIFDGFSKSIRVNGLFQVSGDEELISAAYNQVSYDGFNIAYMDGENQNIFHIGIDFENKARFGFDKYDGSSYNLYIPEKAGTIALLSDIPNTSSFPTLAGTNIWTGSNIFDSSITTKGNLFVSNGITSYTVNAITRKGYIYTFPDDTGTFALTKNIPTRPQYLQGFGIGTPTDFSFETGIYHTLTITLIDNYKSTSIIIPNDYDGAQIDLDIDGDYFEVTLENEKLSVKNTTSNRSWLGKLE